MRKIRSPQLIAQGALRRGCATPRRLGAGASVRSGELPAEITRPRSHWRRARARCINDDLDPQVVHADIGYQWSAGQSGRGRDRTLAGSQKMRTRGDSLTGFPPQLNAKVVSSDVHQSYDRPLGIPYIFKSLPVKSRQILYAGGVFCLGTDAKGTAAIAAQSGKIN
jgi:hypothetical protein